MEYITDPKLQSALVAAVVSIVVTLVTLAFRRLYEPWFHAFKLKKEHEYEQRKKIKEAVASNKIQLVNAAANLSSRIMNRHVHVKEDWLRRYDKDDSEERYYLKSTAFRLAVVIGLCFRAGSQLEYLDSTHSDKEDMDFLKFLKLIPKTISDAGLAAPGDVNQGAETDHIYINNLEMICLGVLGESSAISYRQFCNSVLETSDFKKLLEFVYDLAPDTAAQRWSRMQMLHLSIIMFLNQFGYDFQRLDLSEVKGLYKGAVANIERFEKRIQKVGLNKNRSVCKVLKAIRA